MDIISFSAVGTNSILFQMMDTYDTAEKMDRVKKLQIQFELLNTGIVKFFANN
jgi:hypothetical protein